MEYEEKRLKKRKEKGLNEGNKEQTAEACNNLGNFYNQSGRYFEAIKEYEEESSLYEKLGQNFILKMAKAHRMMGEMFMLLSEFENALKHINIYLKHSQNLNNTIEEQRAYATLGRAYLLHGQSNNDISAAMGQLKNAEKAFIKSLLIVKELTGQISKLELLDMQARLYLNIGVAKEHMGDLEEAIDYKEKAIRICKANDIYELLHLCYVSLSLLYQCKKNNSSIALRFCNLALEVADRLPEKTKKICETLITKAEVLNKEGDFQSAKKVLIKAYKLKTPDLNDRQTIENTLKIVAAMCYTLNSLTKTNMDDYSTRKRLYEKMGDGCCLLQNYNKGIEYYLETLQCAQNNGDSIKQLVPIYISLYQTYKDNKEYDKSLEYLWKEYEANKEIPEEAVATLCNIAEVCELQIKSFWTIYEVYQNAFKESKKIKENNKMQRIVLLRQYKLALKYNMNSIADDIKEDALKENINIEKLNPDDDTDSEDLVADENTPDIGEDIFLDGLTDSNSDSEERDKIRSTRKRGGVSLTIKRNNKGETQLHQACIAGNLDLARRLIDQGHAINVRDHAGWLPLHEACNHGFRDIVEILLDKGGVSAINDKGGTNCDGITPIYDACSNGYLDVIELLLERGANSTLKTDFGDTALNILDKWRNSVDLDYDEQDQYERIRAKMAFELSKIGEKINSFSLKNSTKPKDNSIEKLKRIAYATCRNSDSDIQYNDYSNNSILNVSCSSRAGENFKQNSFDQSNMLSRNILREASTTKISINKKSSAKTEYQNVMENLKHPNRTTTILPETFELLSNKKRGAFLEEDEVDDDWLDNDISHRKKKHKSHLKDNLYATDPSTSKNGENISTYSRSYYTLPTPQKCISDTDSSDNESISKQNAFSILLDSKNRRKNVPKMRRTLSMTSNTSKTSNVSNYQPSLLEKGFCRFRSDSFSTLNGSVDCLIEVEPDSTTTVYESPRKKDQTVIRISPQKVNQTISFRIKVEDELLLVPVERKKTGELTIKWLAEEASRRYYNLIGLKPTLRLMTIDGFGFEESDMIIVAIDENIITSKVLEWKISPLSERYEEMCHQLNQISDENTKSTLEKSQVSNILSLSEWALTPNSTEPIFKALLHQSTLRILNLSNNFIQNDGCKQLGKSLATLKQLKILNLQGNCITSEGLGYLIATQSKNSLDLKFPELEILNLSFNPLGNNSLEKLETICRMSNKLNNLNLQSCCLENIYEYNLNFEKLVDFNISFNNLTANSINKLFNSLNSCLLEKLAMSFTSTGNSDFGLKFYEFLTKGSNEQFKQIEIANCNLTDSDVYKIVKLISKCKNLELINLSNNNRLTGASFKYVLEHLNNTRKIILEECENIVEISTLEILNLNSDVKYPDFISLNLNRINISDREDLYSKIEFLKNFWLNCHKENGKIYSRENYICLYVNEKDLACV